MMTSNDKKVVLTKTALQAPMKDAWDGKTHWERNSPMIAAIASALSLTSAQVDQMFRDADAIRG